MKPKTKGVISVLVLIISAYMMITTKYFNALGDYALEAIGLRAWSNHDSGFHLTVIYFGIFFIIALHYVRKYVIDLMGIRSRTVFWFVLASLTLLYFLTGTVAKSIKGNSEGLLSIGYDGESSKMEYHTKDNEYVEFNAEMTFTNYSKEDKEFYINIQESFRNNRKTSEIQVCELNGEPALFRLHNKEAKTILITLENYNLVNPNKFEHGYSGGYVQRVILEDIKGDRIMLDRKDFIGVELGK